MDTRSYVDKGSAIVRRSMFLVLFVGIGWLAEARPQSIATTVVNEGTHRSAAPSSAVSLAAVSAAGQVPRMPELIGKNWEQTLALLGCEPDGSCSRSSLYLSISHEGPENGTVVQQYPSYNQPLGSRKIIVHVAFRPQASATPPPKQASIAMPNLTGLSLDRVYSEFGFTASGQRTSGSVPIFRGITYKGPPDGIVIEQSPSPGVPVYPGRAELSVTLTQQVVVPNLIGLTSLQAPGGLRNVGLIFRQMKGPEQGVVVAQSPEQGSRVLRGSVVEVQFGAMRVSVPDLTGMQEDAAVSRIREAQLGLGGAIGPSGGKVVRQKPVPGTLVAQGSTVVIELYLPQVDVPNLLTCTAAAAASRLQQDGLKLISATGPRGGQVISQTPEAHTRVFVGSAVSVVLAAAPADEATVPQLVGDSLSNAIRALSSKNLRPGNIAGDSNGIVQSQGRPPGTRVPMDTPIDLQMSATTVAVPSLLGMDKPTALAALVSAGLIAGDVAGSQGVVSSQSPEAGEHVAHGSEVALTLSSVPAPRIAVPDLSNLSLSAATGALTKIGLRLGHPSGPSSGRVLRQAPVPETLVALNSQVDVTLTQTASVRVPSLTDLTENDADAQILAAHLQVGPILGKNPGNDTASARVVTQTPAAGSEVPVDTAVSFAIAVPNRSWPWAAAGGFAGLLGASAFFCPRLRKRVFLHTHIATRAVPDKAEIKISQSPRIQHEMTFRSGQSGASCVIHRQPQITSSERHSS